MPVLLKRSCKRQKWGLRMTALLHRAMGFSCCGSGHPLEVCGTFPGVCAKQLTKARLKFPILGFASSAERRWDLHTREHWHPLQQHCRILCRCPNVRLSQKPSFPAIFSKTRAWASWHLRNTTNLSSPLLPQRPQRLLIFLKQNASLFDSSHPGDWKCKNPDFCCFSGALTKDIPAWRVI